METLGHSQISLTLNTLQRTFCRQLQREAATKLESDL